MQASGVYRSAAGCGIRQIRIQPACGAMKWIRRLMWSCVCVCVCVWVWVCVCVCVCVCVVLPEVKFLTRPLSRKVRG